MAYKVIIFPEAELDISEAALWYNDKQQGLGKRFVSAVVNEVGIIRKSPLIFEIRYRDVRTAPVSISLYDPFQCPQPDNYYKSSLPYIT